MPDSLASMPVAASLSLLLTAREYVRFAVEFGEGGAQELDSQLG
jgi:hypothetical protein